MAEPQGGLRQVELPMSRIGIGDYLGLTIETVSRVFTLLKTKGVVSPAQPAHRDPRIGYLQAMGE